MDTAAIVNQLVTAIETRVATTPFAEALDLTVDRAYEVQDAVLARLGEPITAAKLGLTSRAKQQQMSVDEPLYGWMVQSMLVGSGGRGRLQRDRFIQPRAEPEIAFYTAGALSGPEVTVDEVMEATDAVAPAIDILDSRFTGYSFSLADVTADNASAAGYVLGDPRPVTGNLAHTGCVLSKNGEIVATAAGAAVMDHPAESVAWFVRKLHQRGRSLPAGSLVLAGAWTAAISLDQGDVVVAEFDRYGQVEVACE